MLFEVYIAAHLILTHYGYCVSYRNVEMFANKHFFLFFEYTFDGILLLYKMEMKQH